MRLGTKLGILGAIGGVVIGKMITDRAASKSQKYAELELVRNDEETGEEETEE